jgi:hypothetical protein
MLLPDYYVVRLNGPHRAISGTEHIKAAPSRSLDAHIPSSWIAAKPTVLSLLSDTVTARNHLPKKRATHPNFLKICPLYHYDAPGTPQSLWDLPQYRLLQ